MSIFDPGKDIPDAPTWRCPHCRTLQPETSRCRACLRATVTCASCGHFRPTLVSGLGLCANDRTRAPLGSDEVHPCWVTAMAATRPGSGLLDDPVASITGPAPAPSARPLDGRTARSGPDSASTTLAVEPDAGSLPPTAGLHEAPHVPPARRLTSELRRRSGRGRG